MASAECAHEPLQCSLRTHIHGGAVSVRHYDVGGGVGGRGGVSGQNVVRIQFCRIHRSRRDRCRFGIAKNLSLSPLSGVGAAGSCGAAEDCTIRVRDPAHPHLFAHSGRSCSGVGRSCRPPAAGQRENRGRTFSAENLFTLRGLFLAVPFVVLVRASLL